MKKKYLAVLMSLTLTVSSAAPALAAAGETMNGSCGIEKEADESSLGEQEMEEDASSDPESPGGESAAAEEDTDERAEQLPGKPESSGEETELPEEGTGETQDQQTIPEEGALEKIPGDESENVGEDTEIPENGKEENGGDYPDEENFGGETADQTEEKQGGVADDEKDQEESLTLIRFLPLEKPVYELSEKPELAELLKMFPKKIKGILTDGKKEFQAQVAVEWECSTDYGDDSMEEYSFEAVPETVDYDLSRDRMPEILIRICRPDVTVLSGEAGGITVTLTADGSVLPADGSLQVEMTSEETIISGQSARGTALEIRVLDGEGGYFLPDPEDSMLQIAFTNEEWAASGMPEEMELYQMVNGELVPAESAAVTEAGNGVECRTESLSRFILTFGEEEAAAVRIGDNTYATLKEAFAAVQPGETETIVLLKDISGSETAAVKDGKHIILDLNGYDIGFQNNALLGVKGGILELKGKGTVYEEQPLNGAVQLVGTAEKAEDYSVLIVGEDVTLRGNYALMIYGEYGAGSGERKYANGVRAEIFGTVEGVDAANGYPGVGVYVNGTIHPMEDMAPAVNLYDHAEVSGTDLGMYIAGYTKLQISGCAEVSGFYTGIEIRAGQLSLQDDAVIRSDADYTDSQPNPNGSTTVGPALAVVQHTTAQPIDISVSGGRLKGHTPLYQRCIESNPKPEAVSLSVTGGHFETVSGGTKTVDSTDKKGFLRGGVYSLKPDEAYVADGCLTKENEDGTYEVISADEAFFTVLADGKETDRSNPVHLDLNGQTGKEEVLLQVSDKAFGPYTWMVSDDRTAELSTYSGDSAVLRALKEGKVQLTILSDLLGESRGVTLNVVITDSAKEAASGSEASRVTADIEEDQIQLPPVEGTMTEEQERELESLRDQLESDLKTDLEQNEAVNGYPVQTSENATEKLMEAGLLSGGQKAVISTRQVLQEVIMGVKTEYLRDEQGNIVLDENSEKIVRNVIPYISSMRYSVKPTYRLEDLSGNPLGTEEVFDLDEKFFITFRIPVPSSVEAAYANVEHISDDGETEFFQNPVEGKEKGRYVEITTDHFSEFVLTFTDEKETGIQQPSHSEKGGSGTDLCPEGWWIPDSQGWRFRNYDGSFAVNCWKYILWNGSREWYHFDENGYMQTGWFEDGDGKFYYLHPLSDGSQGKMITGFCTVEGKEYYFNPVSDGTKGALYRNRAVPDGRSAGEDGAIL